jgi:hypothetical protein
LLIGFSAREGDMEGEEFLRLNAEIRMQVEHLLPLSGIVDAAAVENFKVSSQVLRSAALLGSP